MPDPALELAVEAARSKKARDLVVLDLRGLSDVTDYFLICHGTSARQVQSITTGIDEALRAHKRRPKHVEGYSRGEWVLMDYFDIVAHIFTEDRRKYYALEKLWGDAPRLLEPGKDDERRDARRRASGGASRKS